MFAKLDKKKEEEVKFKKNFPTRNSACYVRVEIALNLHLNILKN